MKTIEGHNVKIYTDNIEDSSSAETRNHIDLALAPRQTLCAKAGLPAKPRLNMQMDIRNLPILANAQPKPPAVSPHSCVRIQHTATREDYCHYFITTAVAEGQRRVEELFYSKDTHHDIQKTILTIQFCRDKAGIQKTMAAQ